MNEIEADLRKIHKMIWDWRGKYHLWFATPEPLMSLYFAETEFGEARDAWIRETTTGFNRRAEKDISYQKELTQVLFMLLSAARKYSNEMIGLEKPGRLTLAGRFLNSAVDLLEEGVEFRFVYRYIMTAAVILMQLIDDPVARMQEELDRLYEKRVKPRMEADRATD